MGFEVNPQRKIWRTEVERTWRPCNWSCSTYLLSWQISLNASCTRGLKCAAGPRSCINCALTANTFWFYIDNSLFVWTVFLVYVWETQVFTRI